MKANWISSLKLRAGWGQIGNQNIGSYVDRSLLSLWAQYGALFGARENETLYQGIAARRLGNPDINGKPQSRSISVWMLVSSTAG